MCMMSKPTIDKEKLVCEMLAFKIVLKSTGGGSYLKGALY